MIDRDKLREEIARALFKERNPFPWETAAPSNREDYLRDADAALAVAEAAIRADERERCAKAVERQYPRSGHHYGEAEDVAAWHAQEDAAEDIAATIRALEDGA